MATGKFQKEMHLWGVNQGPADSKECSIKDIEDLKPTYIYACACIRRHTGAHVCTCVYVLANKHRQFVALGPDLWGSERQELLRDCVVRVQVSIPLSDAFWLHTEDVSSHQSSG